MHVFMYCKWFHDNPPKIISTSSRKMYLYCIIVVVINGIVLWGIVAYFLFAFLSILNSATDTL